MLKRWSTLTARLERERCGRRKEEVSGFGRSGEGSGREAAGGCGSYWGCWTRLEEVA